MWKTFGSSIGLLTIAMMAALYSSSATRDGRLAPAAMSAALALILALWVGIRFVPRLAANVDWDWLPFLSHYQITREGWIYFGAVTVVIFAAINTSNNLLYMVLSALLAVLLLSGFLSGLNFRFVRVELRMPTHCYAREPFSFGINVHNEKRLFPSFSLQFESPAESDFQYAAFYIPVVRPLRSVHQSGQAILSKRGRYAIRRMHAKSRYPFGFFVKERKYKVEAECICYPEIVPQEQLNFSVVDAQGSIEQFERGFGHDLYLIRDYLPSDSTRHVHWKASAKTSVLKTREYAAEETRRVVLAFDRFGRPPDAEKFEQLVSYVASLAYHLIKDGVEVALVSDETRVDGLDAMLEYLALVEMSERASPPSSERAVVLSLRTR